MQPIELKPNHVVTGPLLPEPVKIIAPVRMGDSVKLTGEGMHSGKVHQPVLTVSQIAELEVSPEVRPFDGDAAKFRLGVEAIRLGLAYEYGPYFSLSIQLFEALINQKNHYPVSLNPDEALPYVRSIFNVNIYGMNGNICQYKTVGRNGSVWQ